MEEKPTVRGRFFAVWFLRRRYASKIKKGFTMRLTSYLSALLAVAVLSGCASSYPTFGTGTSQQQSGRFRLAADHWSDVAKIRNEATRLGYQISEGKLTKVQAAQYLDRYRKDLVGRNQIDDEMYTVYLRSAVESQRGEIDTARSKQQIQDALRGWQQRWPHMQNKPSNPAFTNFLMEVMGMRPLQ